MAPEARKGSGRVLGWVERSWAILGDLVPASPGLDCHPG